VGATVRFAAEGPCHQFGKSHTLRRTQGRQAETGVPRVRAGLFIATGCGSVLTGAVVFALFLVASNSALDRDLPLAKAKVAAAFRSGQLVENPYQEGSTTIGSHQWNDCLITAMAIDQRGDRSRLALSPIIAGFPGLAGDANPCAILKKLISGSPPEAELYYYDRYVHGATVLLRYLLPHFRIGQIRSLYRAAMTGILIGGLALTLIGIARNRRVADFAVLAVTLLALTRFFGLESFSQSLGHGPADFIAAAYVLAIAVMVSAPVGPVAVILAAALFGSLTIVFELFTGGVPLGLAMVIGLASLGVRSGDQPREFVFSACAAGAYCGAAAVTYLLKVAATSYVAGPGVIADIAGQLVHYSPGSELGPNVFAAAAAIARSVGVLAGGMTLLASAFALGAIAAGGYGLRWILRRVSSAAIRQRAILLTVSVLPIPAWFLAFPNQVQMHAWFMDRIIVWAIAAGFSVFLMAIAARFRPVSTADGSDLPGAAG
jgi:hypothetical protein